MKRKTRETAMKKSNLEIVTDIAQARSVTIG